MLNWIVSGKLLYLKPFYCEQTNDWSLMKIFELSETIYLCKNNSNTNVQISANSFKNQITLWNNPHGVVVGRSIAGPVVRTALFLLTPGPRGHFTSWTKITLKTTEEEKKKRQNTDLRTARRKKSKSDPFLALCVCIHDCCVWLSRELRENPKQLPWILTLLSVHSDPGLSLDITFWLLEIRLSWISPQLRDSYTAGLFGSVS